MQMFIFKKNRCVLCRNEVPEGRQVCPQCADEADEKTRQDVQKKYAQLNLKNKECNQAMEKITDLIIDLCSKIAAEKREVTYYKSLYESKAKECDELKQENATARNEIYRLQFELNGAKGEEKSK